jgi:hypothetical protein
MYQHDHFSPHFDVVDVSTEGLPVVVARKKTSTAHQLQAREQPRQQPRQQAQQQPVSPGVVYIKMSDVAVALEQQQPLVNSPADNLRELKRLADKKPDAVATAAPAASSSSPAPVNLMDLPTVGRRLAEKVMCGGCQKPFDLKDIVYLEACEHQMCAMCLRKPATAAIAKRSLAALTCPMAGGKCKKAPTQAELKLVLNETEFAALELLSVREALTSSGLQVVACVNPKCDNMFEPMAFDAASFKANKKEKGADGKVVPEALQRHKAEHRLRCRECGSDWCQSCGVTPYHEARTCEQAAQFKAATHCRFCDEVVKKPMRSKHAVFASVCGSKDCMTRKSLSCTKALACGHACGGVRDEAPCLDQCLQCEPAPAGALQTGDDYCAICQVEAIKSAPAVKLRCGHMFHYECVRRKVAPGWVSSRITFAFLECPLCAAHISHPALLKLTAPHAALFDVVRGKALERLEIMKERDAKELLDPASAYYGKPDKYAMARYCYYPCFKCKKPYYGGEKACGAPVQAEEFSAKDLVCGACSTGKNETCRKHGKEYIEYKCRFCCDVACFFCWGTTHFCEAHHKVAPKIAKVPVDQLPKCTCGQPHPPNGTEFCLGCSLCRLTDKAAKSK